MNRDKLNYNFLKMEPACFSETPVPTYSPRCATTNKIKLGYLVSKDLITC
jgi:hypothetical protein